MESETEDVKAEEFEGRYMSAGPTSVAWRSETGPREQNQDHARCRLRNDGSWLIAVADGLGGHPRGRAAARRAIRALPRRIVGSAEMWSAFGAANQSVAALAPPHYYESVARITRAPASTLCVAAWTPEDGLAVGVTGDTLPVLVWSEGGSWHGRSLCAPHRSDGDVGYLTLYLGQSAGWRDEPRITDLDEKQLLAGADLEPPDTTDSTAIVILSDGAWEAILRQTPETDARGSALLGAAVASLMNADTTDATDAKTIAERIMQASRQLGIDDNSTVAVAHFAAVTDSGAMPGD